MKVLASWWPTKYPAMDTCPRDPRKDACRLPVFGARRNGRPPTSGANAPIGTPGYAGLMAGRSALLAKDCVTTASRYVYAPLTIRCEPTLPSTAISTPRARYDDEFTYALDVVAAATSRGTPNNASALLLKNSIRSS